MSRLNRLRTLGGLRGRALSGSVAASDLLSQIQTPTLAWGDIKTGATPWYSDAGTTPAVPADGVYRLTEHLVGSQYFEQPTAGARATLTDGTPYDYLTFDGGDSYQSPSNSGITGDAAFEVVAVVNPVVSGNASVFCFGTQAGGFFALYTCFDILSGGLTANCLAGYAFFGTLTTGLKVIRVRKAAGAVFANTRVWVNGVEVARTGGSDGTPNIAAAPFQLGCRPDGDHRYTSAIASVLVYTTPLNDAQQAADDATVKTYFGIA